MTERKIRTLHEEGHRRKFLVVVDDSRECSSAVYFSACRATSTNSNLVMLYVVESGDFQHWLSVGEIHREEGEQKAAAVFRLYQRKLNAWGFDNLETEEVVHHGEPYAEITATILDDQDISFLVLGASTSSEGPGKLISRLAGKESGTFPVPIVIVPGTLDFDEIKALA
jgi:nucleotide-binding universal stress UspA family protein